jgi:hypothetical protein
MRRYRGEFRELSDLKHGDQIEIAMPDGMTAAKFRRSITGAVNWLAWSRKRQFKTKTLPTGAIRVTRILTDDEFDAEQV